MHADPGGGEARQRSSRAASNAITVVDPNPKAKFAYPICTFTWVIVPLKTGKAPELKKFIDWAVTKGQSYGPTAALRPSCRRSSRQAARKTLAKLHT